MKYKNIQISSIDASNIDDAYILFKQIFNSFLSKELFVKKYDASYLNNKSLGSIAYFNNKPIGIHGAFPALVKKDNGSDTLIAQCCDFGILNEHKGQGIGKELALHSLNSIKEMGCEFAFAIFTEQSKKVCLKMDWKVMQQEMYRFHFPIHELPLWKLTWKLNKNNPIKKIREVRSYLQEQFEITDTILNVNSDNEAFSYKYSKAYFDYKFQQHSFIIKIDSVKFWLKVKSYIEIGAVEYSNASEFKAAIIKLRKALRTFYFKEMIISATYNSPLYKDLCEIAKPLPSFEIGYLNILDPKESIQLNLNSADYDTF